MMSPNMTPAFMVSRLRQTCWHKGSQSHALWAVMEGGFMFKALARASIYQDKVSSQQDKPEKSLFNWKLPRRNHNASLCRRSGCPINFCAALSVYRMSSASDLGPVQVITSYALPLDCYDDLVNVNACLTYRCVSRQVSQQNKPGKYFCGSTD